MLYFSLTVCVLTPSSSLPALLGARLSSKGEAKGPPPYRESREPADSELQEVLRLVNPLWVGLRGLSSSRKRLVLFLRGGSNSSALSAGALF